MVTIFDFKICKYDLLNFKAAITQWLRCRTGDQEVVGSFILFIFYIRKLRYISSEMNQRKQSFFPSNKSFNVIDLPTNSLLQSKISESIKTHKENAVDEADSMAPSTLAT